MTGGDSNIASNLKFYDNRYMYFLQKKKKKQEQAYNVVIITVTSRSSYKKVYIKKNRMCRKDAR
jgi:hypothetical protein